MFSSAGACSLALLNPRVTNSTQKIRRHPLSFVPFVVVLTMPVVVPVMISFAVALLRSRIAGWRRILFGRGTAGSDMIDSGAMPSDKKKASHSEQDARYAVGDRVKVSLHTGRIVDATVKAVIEGTDGKRLRVDFGKDETALIHLWQVIEKVR